MERSTPLTNLEVLATLTVALEKEVERIFWAPGVRDTSRRRTKRLGTARLLLSKHQEVLVVLRRLVTELTRHEEVTKIFFERREALPRGRITDAIALSAIREQGELSDAIVVDIKSLYVWCADIHDVYRTLDAGVDLDELSRIKIIRNCLITHLANHGALGGSREAPAGLVFGNGKFEILLHPFNWDRHLFTGLRKTVKAAQMFVPQIADVIGNREQVAELYRHYNALPSDLQKETKRLVGQAGIGTEHPAVLATALLNAIREFLHIRRF